MRSNGCRHIRSRGSQKAAPFVTARDTSQSIDGIWAAAIRNEFRRTWRVLLVKYGGQPGYVTRSAAALGELGRDELAHTRVLHDVRGCEDHDFNRSKSSYSGLRQAAARVVFSVNPVRTLFRRSPRMGGSWPGTDGLFVMALSPRRSLNPTVSI